MKRLCWFLALAIFIPIAIAQSKNDEPRAEKSKIIALENAWNQAQIHRDGEALAQLTADNFVYTDWDGTLLKKAEFIADSKDPSVRTTLVANDDVEVYLYPGVAIVTGAYHAKGTSKGKPFDNYGRFTDTWIYLTGVWQCVASHTNHNRKPGSK